MRHESEPVQPPACLLSGGETTVTLGDNPGKGGRNQEFVLAAMIHLGASGLENLTVLSGGTDGEDGPTDAAGAVADAENLEGRVGQATRPRRSPSTPRRLPHSSIESAASSVQA